MVVDNERDAVEHAPNEAELEAVVMEVVDADTPPAHALGDTTDYRQVVIAWGKKHGLTLEELLTRLADNGGIEAQQLASAIRSDPEQAAAFTAALQMPFDGEESRAALEQVHTEPYENDAPGTA
jgi:hypothetical protein